MQDYNEIDYAHCILLDHTNTKILLVKEYKPLINDYVITVPTIPINYDNYAQEIKSWFEKNLSMEVLLNDPETFNTYTNPDITNKKSTIVHVFKKKNITNEKTLENFWLDFKDVPSILGNYENNIDEFTSLILSHYLESSELFDIIDRSHKEDRAKTLLKAAYDLLHKQTESPYVLDMLAETAVWDGAECDGYCLLEDIAEFLGIEE